MYRLFPVSSLYDQNTFYRAFERDLRHARQEVIIECPFITRKRVDMFLPIFRKLSGRCVQIIISTRHPEDHEGDFIANRLMRR